MVSLLVPPTFGTDEQTQRARILHFVICGTVLIAVVFMTLAMTQQPIGLRGPAAVTFISVLGVLLLRLNRRGHTRWAGILFTAGLISLITVLAIGAGGVRSPGVTMYFVIVLMTGLLLGEREGAVAALVCAGLGLGLLMAENFGLLPPAVRYNSTAIWLLSCLYMGVVIVLLRLPTLLIRTALLQAESELSERKRAEELLRENQALLENMIENTPAAVAMFDTDMRYIACSKRWLTDYRLGDRDLKGVSHYEVFPEINEDWKDVHRRCLAGARETREEDPFARADGTEDIIRWAVQPWRRGNGDIGGITMFTEVITGQVRAREERGLLADRLQQAQKIEALGTLAGGVAHDFNNLLAMIGTNAELGLAGALDSQQARASFLEIAKATLRAKHLVRQILLFGRRHDSAREIISISPVIEEALTFLRATLPANVEFHTDFQAELPPVFANAPQVYQILMNLGTNAGQAMPSGGALSVRLERIAVTKAEAPQCGHLQNGTYVRLTVQDTGTGMSPEILDRIFEPFFTTRGLEGTGLGLSVVHGLVKDHDGAITIESEPGKGSTFHVYFPAMRDQPVALPVEEKQPGGGKGQHIMYIDDEKGLGAAMKRVLGLLGYRCTFYSDPCIAVDSFRSNPYQFDAVLSDVTMPIMSGLDVAKELHAIRRDLPIALTSGRSSQGIDELPFYVRGWISKPATIDELSNLLEFLLRDVRQMAREAS